MAYPATLEVDTPDKIANWRAIGQIFMAIPHLIINNALSGLAGLCALVGWFAILFTGKMPEGLSNMICGALRYQSRTSAYAGFLHDQFPTFNYSPAATDTSANPVRVTLQPTLEGRNRLTCFFRPLVAIPAALFMVLILIVAVVCQRIAFFAVLFTGKWPVAMRNWVLKSLRVMLRFDAYLYLLTDVYPPFSTD